MYLDKLVATDATYKLIWQGYPLILVGTTDMDKKFHPYGMLLTKHEASQDFAFMFKSLVVKVKEIFEQDYDPDTLLADSSSAITNGFTIGFGKEPRRNLYSRLGDFL